MSSKKTSFKVMPILSIVFFGIGLLLLLLKAVWAIAYRMVLYGTEEIAHILLAESGKAFALGFPAIFFIICAGAYLKKSSNYKKLSITALTAQTISCVLLIARLVLVNRLYTFPKNKTYAYIVCVLFAVIGVLCFIAAIKIIKDKNVRSILITASVCGILVGMCLSGIELYQVAAGFAYYGQHAFLLINKCIASLLYFSIFAFYYTAMIFFALFERKPLKR